MITLQRLSVLLAMTLLVSLTSSCRKTIDTNEEIFITLNQTSLVPGNIATITADKVVTQSFYSATISGISIDVVKSGPKELLFIVPVLTTGNHTLIFDDKVFASTLTVTIGSYTPISNINSIYTNYVSETEQHISQLTYLAGQTGYDIDSRNIDLLTSLKDLFASEWSSFPADQQTTIAYYIQNTLADLTLDTFSLNTTYFKQMSTLATYDPGDELVRVGDALAPLTTPAYEHLDVMGASLYKENPPNSQKNVGLTSALRIITEFLYTFSLQSNCALIHGIADTIEGVTPSQLDTFFVTQDTTIAIAVNMQYRTLTGPLDGTSSNTLLEGYASTIIDFDDYWDDASALINRMERWFGFSYSGLFKTAHGLATDVVTAGFDPRYDYLTFDNVSNTNIAVTPDTTGGTLKLHILADNSVTLPTYFTFRIQYTHPVLGITVNRTIGTYLEP